MNSSTFHQLARISLSFLWVFTGISSTFLSRDIGYQVLANGGITGSLASGLIFAGSALDVSIGLWLMSGIRLKQCYLIQIFTITIFTVLLSVIEPEYWLHPFGPLTKNIPLLVLIVYLYCEIDTEYD